MLLHQITIDKNLENGVVIQNLSCGESHIMMILKLSQSSNGWRTRNDGVLHGAKFLLEVITWLPNSDRIIFVDNYFEYVTTGELLYKNGL